MRYTANGIAVTSFTLAVSRPFKNNQGDREADFINCVVWKKQAENVVNYLNKGSLAGVDGRMQTRNYDNNEGQRVFVTEIVGDSVQFLEPKSASGGNREVTSKSSYKQGQGNTDYQNSSSQGSGQVVDQGNQQGSSKNKASDIFDDGKPIDINDDDLPF